MFTIRNNLQIILIMILLSGCTFTIPAVPGFSSATTSPQPVGPTTTPIPAVTVAFDVTLPAPLLPGETLFLSIVDEVTGLGLNPINHAMQGMDTLHYNLTLPFPVGSVVKYRYVRQSTLPTQEDDYANRVIRYRMYYATAPGSVQDIITSWADSLPAGPTGRITGIIVDGSTGEPIRNIMVCAGGQQTLTDSKGEFHIEGLPVGTQNLVAYALDGSFQTFQQGAIVVENKTTPAKINMTAAPLVNVSFTVNVPDDTIDNVPIRLAGNLSTLGNSFGDLDGGLSTVPTRMPVLNPLEDGRYTLSLLLPAGVDIRYKYTLGDGFWNAEHTADGSFLVRQLIVPSSESLVQREDWVSMWQDGVYSPITFELTVPEETPAGDIVSIQFNPYGWTVPIPMWAMGENKWSYILYSPLNILSSFEYRYCRNDQCGVADDTQTSLGHEGRLITSSLAPQELQDTVTDWSFLESLPATSLVGVDVVPRSSDFWAGMEILPTTSPTWQYWMPQAFLNIQALYTNWLVLRPTWTMINTSPLVFSPLPGEDPLFTDSIHLVAGAHALGMKAALFPLPNLPADPATWWDSTSHDSNWWNEWFTAYKAFAIYHADLATQSGSEALILGGEWTEPILLKDATDSVSLGVPLDYETRWRDLLEDVRAHYDGTILWAVSYPGGIENTPAFASDLDGVYLLWNAPLSATAIASVEEMKYTTGNLLDSILQPYQSLLGKPVILAVAYPSGDGSATASIPSSLTLVPGNTRYSIDLQEQADIYQAILEAINERDWVSGFVSRGYYPPAVIHDGSCSVHGKPAADVLWYWFPRLLGITP